MKRALSNLVFLVIGFVLGYTFSLVNVYSVIKKINFDSLNLSRSGFDASFLKDMIVFSGGSIQIDQNKWEERLSGQKQKVADQIKNQLKDYLVNQVNNLIGK